MSTQTMTQQIAEYFKTQPVLKAWLFGSYSRGEQRADSDVDILILPDKSQHFSLQKENNMYKKEGYWDVRPKIKRLSFPKRGKFQVDLQDGRSVTMPISAFPSLKRLSVKERENWYLMGGGVTWDSCPEVIHIEQILGNYQNYAHEAV